MTYIETPRLIIRDWKREDLQSFVTLNKDPEVMEHFLKTLMPTESIAMFNKIKDEINEYGYGPFAIELKEDHSFIGFTGFHNFDLDVDFAPGVEIAWRIHKNYWNQGYVTEAAKACLEYAKENLEFDQVYAFTSLPNIRSQRVMQKIGMTKMKEFDHPLVPKSHPLQRHVLYQILL
ncbi:GCN5-related N-acetyltransferase [Bacteroides coprosuis DSM 18011]|uniref:GCN5-related N-acetyltransferase n=1 Tax=Bacteroides coprosuis DSM 18011 TaxID=679937 RepID=F3ZV25_9BACE|nr:GNAT family N-acetyltransferase [Bacteroides coprosuis]EGJ72483.1 GCN5-related N-acetyltransferase [Bacteroides coprosuis DSM 18011]